MYFESGRAWTFLSISIPLGCKVTRKIKMEKEQYCQLNTEIIR